MIQALTDYLIAESNCRIKIIYELRGSSFDSFSTTPNSVSYHKIKAKSECAECIIASWVRLNSQKMKFPWRIYSINVTKSAVSCGLGQIYWKTLDGNASFFLCSKSNTTHLYKTPLKHKTLNTTKLKIQKG